MTKTVISFLVLASLLCAQSYTEGIEQWRAERERNLQAEDGWLAVAGLYWLEEGRNTFGTDSDNDFVFPEGSTAAHAGEFEFRDGKVTLRWSDGRDEPVEMHPDTTEEPTEIHDGRVSFYVIQRGDRFGIRLIDPESEFRKHFTGLEWYPVDEAYRITARFVPFDTPRTLTVPSVIGGTQEYESPGYLEFELGDRTQRLEPAKDGDELFLIFRDATAGDTTYAAGRFLYTPAPQDGTVELDFNRAYNPPCVFTPYATCPLPPPQNRLDVPVEAGEKNYKHDW